jgi:hypothetical protein
VLAASPRRLQRQSASYHVPPRPLGSRAAGKPFRGGVVLVGFRNGVSARQRAAIERAVGAWGARRLGPAIRPAGSSEGIGYVYESVAGSRAYNANSYTDGPSDPFGMATLDSEQASIYATYLPA